MARAFLDTNVILRHILQDSPEHSPRATNYLARVERGDIEAQITDTVVFEAVFTLQRAHHHDRRSIRDVLLPLLEMPGILLPGKRRLRAVFELYVERGVSFADAYHVVFMRQLGIDEIASFDKHFDRIEGIRRIEP